MTTDTIRLKAAYQRTGLSFLGTSRLNTPWPSR